MLVLEDGNRGDLPGLKISLDNACASVDLGLETTDGRLDLGEVEAALKGTWDTDYHPEQYAGLVLRDRTSSVTVTMYSSRKMNVVGARSVEQVDNAVKKLVQALDKAGFEVNREPATRITNLVFTTDLGSRIDLDEACMVLHNAIYEPSTYAGLTTRQGSPKACFVMFSSGKLICTGTRNEKDGREAIGRFAEEMGSIGLLAGSYTGKVNLQLEMKK
ncbi:MAG: hypothetical protein ACFFCS_12365 [Candidatus Hodarchaeota archaeon]